METDGRSAPRPNAKAQLAYLQRLITLPRETVPKLTAEEAARYLRGTAERLGLELIEISSVIPTFLLLPRTGAPRVLLFQTWHAEAVPVAPAAADGSERLALGTAVAGMEAAGEAASGDGASFGLVVAPAASAGSRGLDRALREHRERLTAQAAYWLRIAPSRSAGEPPADRRRVFLGARGRVVIAMRGGEANPYRIRDAVVEELREQAYGPRPLDFELIRKLAQRPDAVDLLPEGPGRLEDRIRGALFEPRGEVVSPAVAHPDRPRAWLTFDIAEGMEPDRLAARVQELSGAGSADLVESFPWDRANIHHPAVHALIETARVRAGGAEIWPSSPWPTPSGVFSRALGLGLHEWGLPLSAGAMMRFPKPAEFEAMAIEAGTLLLSASTQAT